MFSWLSTAVDIHLLIKTLTTHFFWHFALSQFFHMKLVEVLSFWKLGQIVAMDILVICYITVFILLVRGLLLGLFLACLRQRFGLFFFLESCFDELPHSIFIQFVNYAIEKLLLFF